MSRSASPALPLRARARPRRRRALRVAVALAAVAACGGPGPRPSVLLITVDTLRADYLHSYGFPAESSPNIDALAARGVLFEYAVATAAMTAPSHASIMSSRYVREHSIGASNGSTRLRGGKTLAEHFREAGYSTAAFVTNVVLSRRIALNRGFDVYDEEFRLSPPAETTSGAEPLGEAERTTERVLTWLAAAEEEPFFTWVHYQDPHGAFTPPPPYDEMFPDVPIGSNRPLPVLAANAGRRGIPRYQALPGVRQPWVYARRYVGEIAYADHWIGVLIEAAERKVGRDQLVVLFTADHGESLGEFDFFFQHGHATTPELAQVPLVIAAAELRPGRRSDLVSQVDILPTLLELAGLPPDPKASGVSLVPFLVQGHPLPQRLVFCDIGIEVSGYTNSGYVRVRGGPDLLSPAAWHSGARPGTARTARRLESWSRGPGGRWSQIAADASLTPRFESYIHRIVPQAPAIGEFREDVAEQLRALGYLPPRRSSEDRGEASSDSP